MLSRYLDLTEEINLSLESPKKVVIDVSNYDYFLVQPIGNEVAVYSTLDGGAIQGESDGGTSTAINFISIPGAKISTGQVRTGIENGEIYRYNVVGRYIKITSSNTLTKLLIMLSKIS